MFVSQCREGQIVQSPSKRLWWITGWGEGKHKVALVAADGSGDEVELDAKLLVLISSEHAGALLTGIADVPL